MDKGIKERLKNNWKKLTIGIVSLGTLIYFIITGNEISTDILIKLLGE
jgi:hypothetical protein